MVLASTTLQLTDLGLAASKAKEMGEKMCIFYTPTDVATAASDILPLRFSRSFSTNFHFSKRSVNIYVPMIVFVSISLCGVQLT